MTPAASAQTLRDKAAQALRTGATWLRVDLVDLHWQLSDWWSHPLVAKAHIIGRMVRRGIGAGHSLDGVIVSSGLIFAQGAFTDESVTLNNQTVVLRRVARPARVRETAFIPLSDAGRKLLPLWVELYAAEPGWLDWALGTFGLSAISDIISGN